MERQAHPALAHPVELRVAYAHVLAALVGADNNVRGHELGVLREFCEALQLSPAHTDHVLAFVRDAKADIVRDTCAALKHSELKTTLVSDLLYIAHTDASYDAPEKELIVTIARLLGVSFQQLERMDNYAQAMVAERAGRPPTDATADDTPHEVRANAIAGFSAAILPLAAILAAGQGRAERGLYLLGNGSLALGAAVAGVVGVVAFFSVREVVRRASASERVVGRRAT